MDIFDIAILSKFPHLRRTGYKPTSPRTISYNCIAWSVGDDTKWWWPSGQYYWPEGILNEVSVNAFIEMFALHDYIECINEDLEEGFEKVALYVDSQNVPTHACRQLPNGKWTSKLGQNKDIEHSLRGLMESEYGTIYKVFKRPINSK